MASWSSHRGDEWWYSDWRCEVEASAGAGIFTVETISMKSGELTETLVHWLVWDTFDQLHQDYRIHFSLDRYIKPFLDSLASKGAITWTLLQHPFSKDAVIQTVTKPAVTA